ncbi:MAG: hypothetical protein Q7S21_02160 [archaeon]|nr:hypothetical protein [archaeon]
MRKGQAAITDALFFMMIIAGLATSLFVFTSSFGKDVSAFVEQSYNSTYATTALKTILYSNASRTNADDLSTAKEADFLMTLIKEDYANPPESVDEPNIKVSGVSAIQLRKNIDLIMKPINSANDYMVYVQAEGSTEENGVLNFPFLYTKLLYNDGGDVKETAFFCNPSGDFRNKLDAFVVKANAVGKSVVPIELRQITDNGSGGYEMIALEKTRSEIGLIIWRTKLVEEFSPTDWKCQ